MGFNSDYLSSCCVGSQEHINSIPERPGLKLEKEYYRYLDSCQDDQNRVYVNGIREWSWESLNNNLATIDFLVISDNHLGTLFYIDVVGHTIKHGQPVLNTSHKDWGAICDYMSDLNESRFDKFRGYLAFLVTNKWMYYPIKKDNPKSNIYLSSKKQKQLRTSKSVFGESMTYDKSNRILKKYYSNLQSQQNNLYIK